MVVERYILFVEDDSDLLQYGEEILKTLGYMVLTASDAETASHILNSNTQVDLLVSDIQLPGGVSGLELAATAVSRCPRLKVLLVSGYAEIGLSSPPFPFMEKPYRPSELKRVIHELLETP